MKNLIVSILFLGIVLLFQACGKDTTEFIVTGTTTINLTDTAWEDESKLTTPIVLPIEKLQLAKAPTQDTCTAEIGKKIVVPEDVTVDIPANACVTKNNQICKGKLDIEVLVLRTKGEIVTFDKPTTSGGKLLVSGGVVYISVKQKGEDVKLASGKTLKIRVKSSAEIDGMKLFEGKSMGRFNFDWTPITGNFGAVTAVIWQDSSQSRENKGFDIVTDRFGWINCDKFHDEGNLTNKFAVTLADSFSNRNTSIYLVFKDINSVVKLEGVSSSKQFNIPNGYKGIPIGRKISVVSISNFDNGHTPAYSLIDIQETTVVANNTLKLKPLRLSIDEIKKKILGL